VAARGASSFYRAQGWRVGRAVRSPLPGGESLPAIRLTRG
jgi:hypothetical protein